MGTMLSCNNIVATRVSMNKRLVSRILEDQDLPVPQQRSFKSKGGMWADVETRKIKDYVREHSPAVLKPPFGTFAQDVFVNINDEADTDFALTRIRAARYPSILVEEYVRGDCFRVVVYDDAVIDVVMLRPGFITGDGSTTIHELIDRLPPIRVPGRPARHTELQDEIRLHLERQGLTPAHVPADKETVFLDAIGRLRTGGLAHRVPLTKISSDHCQMWTRAARTMGLRVAGIDFISPDLAQPWTSNRCAINEINSAPYPTPNYRADNAGSDAMPVGILCCHFGLPRPLAATETGGPIQ